MLCYKCNKEKDIESFCKTFFRKKTNTGLCKQCKYLMDKKYREEHKEQIAKKKKEYWENNVNNIKEKNKRTIDLKRTGHSSEYYKDKVCELCGITNDECIKKYGCRLSIHHKDNNGRHNINKGIKPIHNNMEILCNACHCKISNLTERDYTKISEITKKRWEKAKNEGKNSL